MSVQHDRDHYNYCGSRAVTCPQFGSVCLTWYHSFYMRINAFRFKSLQHSPCHIRYMQISIRALNVLTFRRLSRFIPRHSRTDLRFTGIVLLNSLNAMFTVDNKGHSSSQRCMLQCDGSKCSKQQSQVTQNGRLCVRK